MYKTEGVLLKCDNINTEKDAAKLHWETLPDGEHGIKVPREVSDVSEEHSFVTLSDGSIFCVFRTVSGNSYCAYSRDKGHTFTAPEKMTYADGHPMRHPRAANFIWKCQNGKYLYWYHNHGGKTYDDRNPVWLSGAVEYATADGMRLKFSQAEHYATKLVARTYAKYAVNGSAFTVYGSSVTNSIKEIAQSIKDAGGAAYEENKDYIDSILNA